VSEQPLRNRHWSVPSSALLAGILFALALPTAAADAANRRIQACWSDLPWHVRGRVVKLTLRSGVQIRGRVVTVGKETLELVVKKTSRRAVVSKGRQKIPRASVASILVRKSRSVVGRTILTPVLGLAGAAGAAGLLTWEFLAGSSDGVQWTFLFAVAGGTAALGYKLGSRLDHTWVEVVLLPEGAARCQGHLPPESSSPISEVK